MLLAILSLHQSLALGAVGILLCAFSDVPPAILAVRSRFEKLQTAKTSNISNLKEETEDERNERHDDLDVLVDLEPHSEGSCAEKLPERDTKAPTLNSRPPLSIKSVKKAADFGMMETSVHEVDDDYESNSESSLTSTVGSEISSGYESNDSRSNQLVNSTPSTKTSIKNRLDVIAQKAKASYSPAWNVDSNVAVNLFVLIIGLFHLAWLTVSAPIYQRRANRRKAILPTKSIPKNHNKAV